VTNYPPPPGQRYGADEADLRTRIRNLELQLARLTTGPVACTSTTRPANPWTGMPIYETDTGLEAYWSGSAWVYRTQLAVPQQVLGGPAAFVTFSPIPQGFTDLQLVISAKSTGVGSSGYDAAYLQFNGITSANYNWSTWWVTQGGASVQTTGGTSQTSMQCAEIWNSFWGSAGRGIAVIDIPNYSGTANGKGFTGSSSATDGGTVGIQQSYSGGLSAATSTAAITSLKVLMGTGSFVADSTFSLYGLG
jgi:hypothetical protein